MSRVTPDAMKTRWHHAGKNDLKMLPRRGLAHGGYPVPSAHIDRLLYRGSRTDFRKFFFKKSRTGVIPEPTAPGCPFFSLHTLRVTHRAKWISHSRCSCSTPGRIDGLRMVGAKRRVNRGWPDLILHWPSRRLPKTCTRSIIRLSESAYMKTLYCRWFRVWAIWAVVASLRLVWVCGEWVVITGYKYIC
jgi:hypothetical protein